MVEKNKQNAINNKTGESRSDLFKSLSDSQYSWINSFTTQAIIIALLAFSFYINTIQNEYAFDDTIVILKNEYVLQGIAGIPGILSKDGYESYYRQYNTSNQLAGGRYRPLSLITFAIEQQIFGPVTEDKVDSVLHHEISPVNQDEYDKKLIHNMHIRHLMNVLWYTLSVVVLLIFLRRVVFKNQLMIAFLAALIFTIHPIHTEVVANVKSRDEILSLLFICLTFIYAFRYREDNKLWKLGVAMTCFFLAFLSKEYAITLVVLLPLSFYLFSGYNIKKSLSASVPYFIVTCVYLFIRLQIVGFTERDIDTNILNNPYAYAVGSQKIATEIATALNYLRLLVFPHPLSFDYSYNQIPYKDFSNPLVWLSLLVHLGIGAAFVYFFKRRNVICFAIAFYILNLFLVCNIFFDIGATMGERLIFHSSVGFCIAVAYFLYKGMERIRPAKNNYMLLAGAVTVLIILCGYKTISRNVNWKNNDVLFAHDLAVSPNSVLINTNVAISLMNHSDFEKDTAKKIADLRRSVALYDRAIEIHKTYDKAYLNRALAYFRLGQLDSVISDLDKVRIMYPNHPQLPDIYYNLGIAFAINKEYNKALNAWQTTLQLNPNYTPARTAISNLKPIPVKSN